MSNAFKPPCDEAIISSRAEGEPCSEKAAPWILTATILGSSMAFIDGTVVNVALPALQSNLNATVLDVQWVVESYALLLACLLLVGGSLGDRYGRRLIYAIGIATFAAASVWCGLTRTIDELIIARAVQGAGGALLVPGSLAIISASFEEKRRGTAIGTWSGFTSITAAVGPVLGGWLIEHVSWRAIFFINVPVAVTVLFLVFWRVPESRDRTMSHHIDWLGALVVTVGLGCLVYGLIESSSADSGPRGPMLSIVAGIVLLASFVLIEERSKHPMLPLTLFRSTSFSGSNLLTLFLYSALSGALFFVPLNLIQIQGYSATAAGAALLPFIVIMFALSRWSGGLLVKYGARLPLVIGPLIAGAGFALFALAGVGSPYWTSFFPAVVVLGLGMAVSVAPLTTAVMNSAPRDKAGLASGINNAVSRTAGVLAVAVFGVVMLHKFSANLEQRLDGLAIDPGVRTQIMEQRTHLGAIVLDPRIDPQVGKAIKAEIGESFVSGFRLTVLIASMLAAGASLTAFICFRGKSRLAPSQSAEPQAESSRATRATSSASTKA